MHAAYCTSIPCVTNCWHRASNCRHHTHRLLLLLKLNRLLLLKLNRLLLLKLNRLLLKLRLLLLLKLGLLLLKLNRLLLLKLNRLLLLKLNRLLLLLELDWLLLGNLLVLYSLRLLLRLLLHRLHRDPTCYGLYRNSIMDFCSRYFSPPSASLVIFNSRLNIHLHFVLHLGVQEVYARQHHDNLNANIGNVGEIYDSINTNNINNTQLAPTIQKSTTIPITTKLT